LNKNTTDIACLFFFFFYSFFFLLLTFTLVSDVVCVLLSFRFGCADGGEEIPDPFPNSEVKLACGNGTALLSVEE
jgi:hypothetical protein